MKTGFALIGSLFVALAALLLTQGAPGYCEASDDQVVTRRVELAYCDAATVLKAFRDGFTGTAAPASGVRSIVPDPSGTAVWVTASTTEWERTRTLIREMDMPPRDIAVIVRCGKTAAGGRALDSEPISLSSSAFRLRVTAYIQGDLRVRLELEGEQLQGEDAQPVAASLTSASGQPLELAVVKEGKHWRTLTVQAIILPQPVSTGADTGRWSAPNLSLKGLISPPRVRFPAGVSF